MTKLLKYEFLRSSKVILLSSAAIILFNIILLFDNSLSQSQELIFLFSVVILGIFSIMVFYEIGIFKKDFINSSPNIIQLVPKPAFQIIGTKILKAFLCILIYYSIMLVFSLINSRVYINSILMFYNSYKAIPMMIIVFASMVFMILNMVLVGILSLIIAHRVSFDKKKALGLAIIFGVLTFMLILFLLSSVKSPFVYSDNIFECECLAVIFVILYSSISLLLDNKQIISKLSIKYFVAPILLILAIFAAAQGIAYYNRIVERIDYSFESDQEAIGQWESIGRVDDMESFNPAKNRYVSIYPELEKVNIMDGGKTDISDLSWTRSMLVNNRLSTVNPYEMKTFNGIKYMFVQWKNEEFVYEHIKPFYLVLQEKKLN